MKTTLSALAAVLVLCASAFAQVDAWKKLEGHNSGVRKRTVVTVNDSAAWQKVWKQHNPSAAAPTVDFSRDTVVAVFLGETRSAGVKVEIVVQNDPLAADAVTVFYREIRAKESFNASVITYPYAIVRLPKSDTVTVEADQTLSIPEKSGLPQNPEDKRKMRALIDGMSAPSFDGR